MTVLAATINSTAVVVFAVILAVTLGITYWASKRAGSTTEFYAAGRGITGTQNASRSRATICRRPRSSASQA